MKKGMWLLFMGLSTSALANPSQPELTSSTVDFKLSPNSIAQLNLDSSQNEKALAKIAIAETQIKQVVEQFKSSIINKDKATFGTLFYSEDIPFIAVFSDEMRTRKRVENPNYPAAVNFGKFGSVLKMISDDEEQEEKIWNLKVQTDGYLGTVHFDYSDHLDGKMRAWGTESWSLVKVEESWKITSISFTVTEVDVESKK